MSRSHRMTHRSVGPSLVSAVVAVLATHCSLALDFEDIEDLPCDPQAQPVDCQPGFTCLSTGVCIRNNSVDDYKQCDALASNNGDDQCQPDSRCVTLERADGLRPTRCLPRCSEPNLIVSGAGGILEQECGPSRFCWPGDDGGFYCDDGECQDLPNNCPPPRTCYRINGAGVCIRECDIFGDNTECGTNGHCQPIVGQRVMGCLDSETSARGAVGDACGLDSGCANPLVCLNPQESRNEQAFCREKCNPASGNTNCSDTQTQCALAVANIDGLGTDLGVCD